MLIFFDWMINYSYADRTTDRIVKKWIMLPVERRLRALRCRSNQRLCEVLGSPYNVSVA